MTTQDQEIGHVRRLREALDALAAEAAPGGHCPDADRLWDASRGELASHETEEIVDHLSACRACARVWRLAVDLGREAPTLATVPALAEAEAAPYWTLARLAPAFVGSFVVIIAGALLFQIWQGGPEPAALSDSPTRQFIEPSALVDIIEPDGAVPEAPGQLRWEPVPDVEVYQVRIYVEDGTLAWTSDDVAGSSVAWPESVALGNETYYWGVTALRAGEIVAESGLATVELAASGQPDGASSIPGRQSLIPVVWALLAGALTALLARKLRSA